MHLGHETETFAELVFEMLRRADTLELSVHHDDESITQRLALLHAET